MAKKLYSRNAAILVKIEAQEGVDAAPQAQDAMLVSNLQVEPLAGSEVSLDYIRPYFGNSPSIRVEDFMTISFDMDISGVKAPATIIGWEAPLRSAAFAVTSIPEITGSIVSAGPNSCVVDGDYLLSAGAVFNVGGEVNIAVSYDAATKTVVFSRKWQTVPAASTAFTVPARQRFNPITNDVESSTIYYYADGILHRGLGSRGNVSFEMQANNRPVLKFQYTCCYGGIVDVDAPVPDFSKYPIPAPVTAANTAGILAGQIIGCGEDELEVGGFTMDLANAVKHRQLIGCESVVLTDRKPKGTINVQMTQIGTFDWFEYVRHSKNDPLVITHGREIGNIVSFEMAHAQLSNLKYSDSDGVIMLDSDLLALPGAGNDEIFITVS